MLDALRAAASTATPYDILPDDSLIAVGTVSGWVEVINATSGEIVWTATSHRSRIAALRFSPDGTMFATASADNTARVWGVQDQAMLTLSHAAAVLAVTFDARSERLATAATNGSVRIYPLSTTALLDASEQHVTRAPTDEECSEFYIGSGDGCEDKADGAGGEGD